MPKKTFKYIKKAENRLCAFIELQGIRKRRIAERLFITRSLYEHMRSTDVSDMPGWRQWQIKNEFGIEDDQFLRLVECAKTRIAANCKQYTPESTLDVDDDD